MYLKQKQKNEEVNFFLKIRTSKQVFTIFIDSRQQSVGFFFLYIRISCKNEYIDICLLKSKQTD